MDKKITLATVKRFIKANRANLLISCRSSFDGMTDCVQSTGDNSFSAARVPEGNRNHENKLGIEGAWFVFDSRDRFHHFETEELVGIDVYNCCGDFILAVRKDSNQKGLIYMTPQQEAA
jgi:hypothetical protein